MDETTRDDGDSAKAPVESGAPEATDIADRAAADAGPMAEVGGADFSPRVAWLLAVAAPVLAFVLVPPLTRSGIWDPHELAVADLARRVALHLHGASGLALEGADNWLPHLNDLGRPQLPFTSIAVGFKLFGLHDWAGRLPLAVWGIAGVLAVYGVAARLVDRRAGVYAAVALTTMPLYLVHARTMLGEVVTMSSMAMAFAGLTAALLLRDSPRGLSERLLWLALGALGLVSGYYARGGLIGVAVPTLAVGLGWLVLRAGGRARDDGFGLALGAASLACGVAIAFRASVAMDEGGADLSPWLGAMVRPPSKYTTFDFVVGHLGPALAPWSAFVPFAFGRLFRAPSGVDGAKASRETELRALLVAGAAVAFAAHGWLAARTDLIAFSAPAILALVAGLAIRDYERGAAPSVAVGVGTAVVLGLLHHDFHKMPEKAFQAFGIAVTTFPDGFKDDSVALWWVALGGFAVAAFFTFVERGSERAPFEPARYLKGLIALRDAWDGLLALAYFAVVAGASLAGLAVWIGTRTHAKWLPQLSSQMREIVMHAWWLSAFLPLAAVFGVWMAADLFQWAFARDAHSQPWLRGFEPLEAIVRRLRRGGVGKAAVAAILGREPVKEDAAGEDAAVALIIAPLMLLAVPAVVVAALTASGRRFALAAAVGLPAGLVLFLALGALGKALRGSRPALFVASAFAVGLVLGGAYYPALANQLSPKEVFESYQRARRGDEPLALFGVGGKTAAYYAGGQPTTFRDAPSAYRWLSEAEGGRRFIAVRAEELARLNRLHRDQAMPPQNLPVLDARSSQILLVASALAAGEVSASPLDAIVLASPPEPSHKVTAVLDGKLRVLGYDIVDPKGRVVDFVTTRGPFRMKTYFEVLEPLSTEWQMFIHIDGNRRRHNGDHKVAEGKYPFSLWRPGDIVCDDYEFTLPPNFAGGSYSVFFGLFVGDTRMKVTEGPHDRDDRVDGGQLRVR